MRPNAVNRSRPICFALTSALMTNSSFRPEHDALRRALAWLAEQHAHTPGLIEEACQRFDVTPVDEEFLLHEYRRMLDDAKK